MTVEEAVQRLQAGDAAGAVGILKQVTADEPENGAAFQYLGIALAQTGDSAGGLEALEHAVELLPDSPGVWFNLGVALNLSGSTDEARHALQHAVTLDPSHAKARAALRALDPTETATSAPAANIFAPTVVPVIPTAPTPMGISGLQSVAGYTPTPPPQPILGPQSSPPASGYNYAPPQAGGGYVPAGPPVRAAYAAPSTGLRIGRGLGWGIVYGQIWTVLNLFWAFVYGQAGHGAAEIILRIVLFVVLFGFAGAVVGLFAGATNADVKTGSVIGIVVGLLLFVGEFLLGGSKASGLVNVVFWFFTGRVVGASIAARIQRPVNS